MLATTRMNLARHRLAGFGGELAPVDRDVFRRQVRYDKLEREHAAAVAPPAATPAP